jgi:hypothetical protein
MDPLVVDGFDTAIYRNSAGEFEFADYEDYWEQAGNLDAVIREIFKEGR